MKLIIDGLTAYTPTWTRGIGKVVNSLIDQVMFRHAYSEVIITAFDLSILEKLPSSTKGARIHTISRSWMSLPFDQRAALYAAEIEALAKGDEEVLFWHPNPLMFDQILPYPLNVATLTTVYDYIPLRNAELYLDDAPEQIQREYHRRLQHLKSQNVHIASISDTVADQTREMMPLSDRVHSIPIGFDDDLFTPAARRNTSLRPYIVMVSGDDRRKNIVPFVTAVCQTIAQGHEVDLKIICHLGEKRRADIEAVVSEYGCQDAIEILGFVSDYRLASLVRHATVAAMPSLDEGFGLPVVEAFASGVPVISSDIPTSREVAGDLAYFFDPYDVDSMSDALVRCLEDQKEGRIDVKALTDQAARYSWDKAGDGYHELIEQIVQRTIVVPEIPPKVAFLTPWPPQRSGIATFGELCATKLAADFDLTVVVEDLSAVQRTTDLTMIDETDFDPDDFDLLICQLGNNLAYHTWIYKHARTSRSIPIVHDTYLHPLLQTGFRDGVFDDEYLDMLANHFTPDEIAARRKSEFRDVPVLELTGLSDLVRKSGGLVLHNRFGLEAVHAEVDEEKRCRLAILPMSLTPKAEAISDPRTTDGPFVVGMFGHLTRFKLPFEVISAVEELILDGLPVELRIVGNLGPMEDDIVSTITRSDLGDHVKIVGFADEDAFFENLCACDVVVNLRNPTLGENSGVAYEAMYIGRPVIVSDQGSFADLPDSCVIKVPAKDDVSGDVAAALRDLLFNPEKRHAISEKAKQFTHKVSTLDAYCAGLKKLCFGVLNDLSDQQEKP